jgi:hypothetical protein
MFGDFTASVGFLMKKRTAILIHTLSLSRTFIMLTIPTNRALSDDAHISATVSSMLTHSQIQTQQDARPDIRRSSHF